MDEYKNVRRIAALNKLALASELAERMIGFETTTGYLGAKKPGGVMAFYAPEGGIALFSSVNVSNTTPSLPGDLTSKSYVDNAISIAGTKPLSDILTAGNDAGAKQIRNILAGTADGDVTNVIQTKDIASLYSMSSSVVSGFTITQASPTAINISSGVMVIVDKTNPLSPIVNKYTIPAQTNINMGGLSTQGYTSIQVDAAGTFTQSTNVIPTSVSQQTAVRLGVVSHVFGTGSIEGISGWWTCGHSAEARLNSILQHFGVSKKGIGLSASGSALQIKTTSGQLCADGLDADILSKSPDIQPITALNPSTVNVRLTRSSFYDTNANVDVTQYDLNGTKTAIPGNASISTIHRVYMLFNNVLAIQLGQNTYANVNDALIALSNGSDTFVEHPVLNGVSIRIGYIIVSKGSTNLSTSAIFRDTDKWGDSASSSGGGGVIPNLGAVLTSGSNASNIDITGVSRLTANTGTSYLDLDTDVSLKSPLGTMYLESGGSGGIGIASNVGSISITSNAVVSVTSSNSDILITSATNNKTKLYNGITLTADIGLNSQLLPTATISKAYTNGDQQIAHKKYVDYEISRNLTGTITSTPDLITLSAINSINLPSGQWSDWILPLKSSGSAATAYRVTVTGFDSTNAIALPGTGTINLTANNEYVSYEFIETNGATWKFVKYTVGGTQYYGLRFFFFGSIPTQVKFENVGGYGLGPMLALVPVSSVVINTSYADSYRVARLSDVAAIQAYQTFTFGRYSNTGPGTNTGVGVPQTTDGTITAPKGFMPIRSFSTSTAQSVLGHFVNNFGTAISITVELRYTTSIPSTGLAPTGGSLAGTTTFTTSTTGGGNAFTISGTSSIPANAYVWVNVIDSINAYSQTNCAGTVKLA